MSRVISTQNLATDRNRLMKAMVIALRELGKQSAFNDESRDLAAFLAAALEAIAETVERSVVPWEKRGYWLKADRFRMEWDWVGPMSADLKKAVLEENLVDIAQIAVKLGSKVGHIDVPEHHRIGKPWVGAWAKLKAVS